MHACLPACFVRGLTQVGFGMQADVATAPFIARFAVTLPHFRDFDLLAVDERIRKWHDAFVSRPSWQSTAPTAESLFKAYSTYANPTQ